MQCVNNPVMVGNLVGMRMGNVVSECVSHDSGSGKRDSIKKYIFLAHRQLKSLTLATTQDPGKRF